MASKYTCILVLISWASSAATPEPDYRLPPKAVTNLQYLVELSFPKTEDDSFKRVEGHTAITFTNQKFSDEILFHLQEITIYHVIISEPFNEPYQFVTPDFEYYKDRDMVKLVPRQPIKKNQYYKIDFYYFLDLEKYWDKFYILRPREDMFNYKLFLEGTFQPIQARRVFPCFDDPSYKAHYKFVVRYTKYTQRMLTTGLSRFKLCGTGIELESSEEAGYPSYGNTSFTITALLPTYAVGFVISNYTCEEKRLENVILEVYTSDAVASQRRFTLNLMMEIISQLEKFTDFSLRYLHLSHIRLFAVSGYNYSVQVSAGLIIGREYDLLVDDVNTSLEQKQQVGLAIADALVQIFFHQKVFIDSWSNLYLFKGFCSYVAYHIMDKVWPTLEFEKQLVLQEMQKLLSTETKLCKMPLLTEAFSPVDINNKFRQHLCKKDTILFKMIANIMKIENFQKGVQRIFKSVQVKNPTERTYTGLFAEINEPNDLWKLLNMFVPSDSVPIGFELKDFANNWVNQTGYPFVKVSLSGSQVTLKQQTYRDWRSQDDNIYKRIIAEQKWYLPLGYAVSSFAKPVEKKVDLKVSNASSVVFKLRNKDLWLIVNYQQIGFYRVDYDTNLLARIEKALSQTAFGNIPEMNRAQLISDFFNYAYHRTHKYKDFLELCKFLKYETSYHVWKAAFDVFSKYFELILDNYNREFLRLHILKLSSLVYSSISFYDAKEHDHLYTLKRTMVTEFYCIKLRFGECKKWAERAFGEYKSTRIKVDKDLRYAIYCTAVQSLDEGETNWNWLWNDYLSAIDKEEERTILEALGCGNSYNLRTFFFPSVIHPDFGVKNSIYTLTKMFEAQPYAIVDILNFYQAHNNTIVENFSNTFFLGSFYKLLFRRIRTIEEYEKLKGLLAGQHYEMSPNFSFDIFIRINASRAVNWDTDDFRWTSIDNY